MVIHVRHNSGYISLPSSTKQQLEMTKFCVVWRTLARQLHIIFEIFISDLPLFRYSFALVLTLINKVDDFRRSRDSFVKLYMYVICRLGGPYSEKLTEVLKMLRSPFSLYGPTLSR